MKHKHYEKTIDFLKTMQKLGEKANMNEELIIHTILGNIYQKNQTLYRIHMEIKKRVKN